jgi:hypothetical protein
LKDSLEETSNQLQVIETRLRSNINTYELVLKGQASDVTDVWGLVDNILRDYDLRIALLVQQWQIVVAYSNKYRGFKHTPEEQALFLQRIEQLSESFKNSTAECRAFSATIERNLRIFASAVKTNVSMLQAEEETIEEMKEDLVAEGHENARKLQELLEQEAIRASKLKYLDAFAAKITAEKLAINTRAETDRNAAEAVQDTMSRKCADNDLCLANTGLLIAASNATLVSLDDTACKRRRDLERYKLTSCLDRGNDIGAAFRIAHDAHRSSSHDAARDSEKRSKLQTQLHEYQLMYHHTGVAKVGAKLTALDQRTAPLQERVELYERKKAEYSLAWSEAKNLVTATATELNCIQDSRPEDHGADVVVVSLVNAEGNSSTIRFEHPMIEAMRDEEERRRLLQELRAAKSTQRLVGDE